MAGTVRRLTVVAGWVAVTLAGAVGCTSTPDAIVAAQTAGATATPPGPVETDAGPLCALLSGPDFHQVAGLPAGQTQGGGTATQATCQYGPNLQLVVEVSPNTDLAKAGYQGMIGSGWFTSGVARDAVKGVDESSYGTGPDAAAVTLRRSKLVLTVVAPAGVARPALVRLATLALTRAGSLGK